MSLIKENSNYCTEGARAVKMHLTACCFLSLEGGVSSLDSDRWYTETFSSLLECT